MVLKNTPRVVKFPNFYFDSLNLYPNLGSDTLYLLVWRGLHEQSAHTFCVRPPLALCSSTMFQVEGRVFFTVVAETVLFTLVAGTAVFTVFTLYREYGIMGAYQEQ